MKDRTSLPSELAGRPDLEPDKLMPLVTQHSGEPFSFSKIDQSLAALKKTAQFQDVQLDLRPEQDGVRVMFVLQPSTYFGIYQFAGAGQFAYPRLLQVSNYSPQEPYSSVDREEGPGITHDVLPSQWILPSRCPVPDVRRIPQMGWST